MEQKNLEEINILTRKLDFVLKEFWEKDNEKDLSLERIIEKRNIVLNSINTVLALSIHNTSERSFWPKAIGITVAQTVELLFGKVEE
jgi:hypothetical protein